MEQVKVKDYTFELYLKHEVIQQAINEMAVKIKADFKGKDPLFVCIMNGSFMFAAELMLAIDESYEVAFARYSSYEGTSSTMQLKEIMPVTQSLEGRTVVVLEDLIDTGYTMQCVKDRFLNLGAKEVYIAAMLIKPEALLCDVKTDYIALEIENKFIVGHGLDYDGFGRMYKDIYQLKQE
ncbi:phosphoribosyltransferase [Porphyromonas pogonae]|uniref:phosphoribosyltransferase n=1 Tax=Porphyromonas pogonae TaxID=867595 RepID=UPI002E771FD3|nr:phosphoribosyltransferase family protein [Porphyromonas pogonae]